MYHFDGTKLIILILPTKLLTYYDSAFFDEIFLLFNKDCSYVNFLLPRRSRSYIFVQKWIMQDQSPSFVSIYVDVNIQYAKVGNIFDIMHAWVGDVIDIQTMENNGFMDVKASIKEQNLNLWLV